MYDAYRHFIWPAWWCRRNANVILASVYLSELIKAALFVAISCCLHPERWTLGHFKSIGSFSSHFVFLPAYGISSCSFSQIKCYMYRTTVRTLTIYCECCFGSCLRLCPCTHWRMLHTLKWHYSFSRWCYSVSVQYRPPAHDFSSKEISWFGVALVSIFIWWPCQTIAQCRAPSILWIQVVMNGTQTCVSLLHRLWVVVSCGEMHIIGENQQN